MILHKSCFDDTNKFIHYGVFEIASLWRNAWDRRRNGNIAGEEGNLKDTATGKETEKPCCSESEMDVRTEHRARGRKPDNRIDRQSWSFDYWVRSCMKWRTEIQNIWEARCSRSQDRTRVNVCVTPTPPMENDSCPSQRYGGREDNNTSKTPGQVLDVHTFPTQSHRHSRVNLSKRYFQA